MTKLNLASEFEPRSRNDWLSEVEKVLRGADFEKKLVAKTYDDIRIDPLYSELRDTGAPGQTPFTRGWSDQTDGEWNIDQLHISSDPDDANTAILEDLEGGASSLTIRLNAPGQSGLPADAGALTKALNGVRLDMIALNIAPGLGYQNTQQLITALAAEHPDEMNDARISIDADPVGELARLGALDRDMDTALDQLADLAKSALGDLPVQSSIMVDGRPYHNAGASEAEELAAILATTVTYMRSLEESGITPAEILPLISVTLGADTDIFNTIAKFRAARHLLWSISDACGAGSEAAKITLRAETSERMMTRRDPWVNLLRATAATTGAAIGGAQSITVLPHTWTLGTPDHFARRMTRNCQIVLMEEASLAAVVDPAGGSSYVDYLTDELTRKSWTLFQEIERNGGMVDALQSGHIQSAIRETNDARAKDIAYGKLDITGVSAFPDLTEDPIKTASHAIPAPLDSEAITVEPLPLRRLSEPFEKLRDTADSYKASHGKLPQIFLANLGLLSDFNARANWSASFLSAGGIETITSTGYADHNALIDAFKNSGTTIACICSSDAVYENEAEAIARDLKAAGATFIYLAGRAGEKRDAYRSAGIDAFIHMGLNSLEILSEALDRLGAR